MRVDDGEGKSLCALFVAVRAFELEAGGCFSLRRHDMRAPPATGAGALVSFSDVAAERTASGSALAKMPHSSSSL